ncbi:hypothetical protein L211DRAFT_835369 [Terfezia boudieri ATCC MYA-4762]|uniref:Uncharacterized protein n=1 Tax=Terfezia boudieri ATCC MYA-4762 TaxID=1051890 RepID=A0A3N4LUG2_9PEZI|nr:hypothetical protein L211DRAFT_835369 [Terfezia boudieri ATCC MYA-4762]
MWRRSQMFCSAQDLQVSRAFLLQQAAWLYERELSQVRAQMRKGMGGAPVSNTSTPSGTTSNTSPRPLSPALGMTGGTRMARTGSGGSYGRYLLSRWLLQDLERIH